MKYKKNIVVIGGGTGTSTLLRGLTRYPLKLSAIVTTADTGGSSGRLRKEMGIVPPGDIRQCLVALNLREHPMLEHFHTRFNQGSLKGHTFGNLFLALLWKRHGDFQKAIEELERVLSSKHSVIPVTIHPTSLVAHLRGGARVRGEANIIGINALSKKLKRLELLPRDAKLNPKTKKAIVDADCIVIGPGNLFGSLTPPLLVKGFVNVLRKSRAKKIFVANIMNQHKLTSGFSLQDHLEYVVGVLGEDIFDTVLYNTANLDLKVLRSLSIKDKPVFVDLEKMDARFLGAELLDSKISKQDPADPLKRTFIRHDPDKVAKIIYKIINAKN